LRFTLGNVITGTAVAGSIRQADGPGAPALDQYSVDATTLLPLPGSGSITGTLSMLIEGDNFFNSLLINPDPLNAVLPGGSFMVFDGSNNVPGILTSVTNVTPMPMPLPWTIGLMASGLGSLLFLLMTGIRGRRER